MSDIGNMINGVSTISKVGSVWGWRYVFYSTLLMFSFLLVLFFVLMLGMAISKNASVSVYLIYGFFMLLFMALTRFIWRKLKVISDAVLVKQKTEEAAEHERMKEEAEKIKAERLRVESLPTDERLAAENEAREAAIESKVQVFRKIRNKIISIGIVTTIALSLKTLAMPDILFLKVLAFFIWLIVMSVFGWIYRLKAKELKEYIEYKKING